MGPTLATTELQTEEYMNSDDDWVRLTIVPSAVTVRLRLHGGKRTAKREGSRESNPSEKQYLAHRLKSAKKMSHIDSTNANRKVTFIGYNEMHSNEYYVAKYGCYRRNVKKIKIDIELYS